MQSALGWRKFVAQELRRRVDVYSASARRSGMEVMCLDTVVSTSANSLSDARAECNDRRRVSRRSLDLNSQPLVELAHWFAHREKQPFLIVDEKMRKIVVNDEAARILPAVRVLVYENGHLGFTSRESQTLLTKLQRGELQHGFLNVRVEGHLEKITISAIVLRPGSKKCFLVEMTCTAICLERLRNGWGLTSAEAEIALSIYRGLSLQSIAKARRGSRNTIKTQLRYIYQKLGVHSQSNLTRRIAEVL